MAKDFLWVEKYRPKTIAETILPTRLKDTFQKMVDTGDIPNMMFAGSAGLGKTTVAKAMCNELGLDYILILYPVGYIIQLRLLLLVLAVHTAV